MLTPTRPKAPVWKLRKVTLSYSLASSPFTRRRSARNIFTHPIQKVNSKKNDTPQDRALPHLYINLVVASRGVILRVANSATRWSGKTSRYCCCCFVNRIDRGSGPSEFPRRIEAAHRRSIPSIPCVMRGRLVVSFLFFLLSVAADRDE